MARGPNDVYHKIVFTTASEGKSGIILICRESKEKAIERFYEIFKKENVIDLKIQRLR